MFAHEIGSTFNKRSFMMIFYSHTQFAIIYRVDNNNNNIECAIRRWIVFTGNHTASLSLNRYFNRIRTKGRASYLFHRHFHPAGAASFSSAFKSLEMPSSQRKMYAGCRAFSSYASNSVWKYKACYHNMDGLWKFIYIKKKNK